MPEASRPLLGYDSDYCTQDADCERRVGHSQCSNALCKCVRGFAPNAQRTRCVRTQRPQRDRAAVPASGALRCFYGRLSYANYVLCALQPFVGGGARAVAPLCCPCGRRRSLLLRLLRLRLLTWPAVQTRSRDTPSERAGAHRELHSDSALFTWLRTRNSCSTENLRAEMCCGSGSARGAARRCSLQRTTAAVRSRVLAEEEARVELLHRELRESTSQFTWRSSSALRLANK